MTGLTPVPRVVFQSCTAPAMEPWSVRLTAGISSSAARATRSGTRHAPSRIEYSEWTCRWTKSAWAIAEGHSTPAPGGHPTGRGEGAELVVSPVGSGEGRAAEPAAELLT